MVFWKKEKAEFKSINDEREYKKWYFDVGNAQFILTISILFLIIIYCYGNYIVLKEIIQLILFLTDLFTVNLLGPYLSSL